MSLIIKGGDNEVVLVSEGVHLAVCVGIFELGTQHSPIFDRDLKKVLIMWEVPDETIKIEDEEKPLVISKIYTASLNQQANLRHDLESWRGRVFTDDEITKGVDLRVFLGKGCQIQVIHQPNKAGDRTYANISGIMSLPKGVKPPEPKNKLIYFEIENEEIPEGTPEWVKKMIMNSKEFQLRKGIVEQENDYPPIDF